MLRITDDAGQPTSAGYLLNCFSSTPEAVVELLTISFKYLGNDVVLRYTVFEGDKTYLGVTYKFLPFEVTNLNLTSSGERNRPILNIVNPDGGFSPYLRDGVVEGALVQILRVPASKFKANLPVYRKLLFTVFHVKGYNANTVALELRGGTDGAKSTFPPRSYYPPHFGVVSI